MRDANGRVGFVDMLSPGAAGTVGIYAQIGWVDLNFKAIVNFRVDKNATKRRMTALVRIKRAFTYQAVHPGLGAQQAISVFPFDFDGSRLNTRDIAFGVF